MESGAAMSPSADPRLALLNPKEAAVYAALAKVERASLAQLAPIFRRKADKAQSNSWVRNSMRKLVRLKLVTKVGDGVYAITA